MKKNKLFLVVAMILILTMAFVGCAKENSENQEDIIKVNAVDSMEFKLIKGNAEYELIKLNNFEGTEVTIPTKYNNKPVTSIGKEAFSGYGNLTKINIPNTITSISDKAFNCCKGLKYITLPTSIQYLGHDLFNMCDDIVICYLESTNLISPALDWNSGKPIIIDYKQGGKTKTGIVYGIESDNSVTIYKYIGNLQNLKIPEKIEGKTVTKINRYAFANSLINSIVLPETITYIGFSAFENNYIKSIVLPNNISYIGSNAFKDCRYLEEIELPQNISYIGSNVFENCNALKEIELPSSTKKIIENAFNGCENLTIYCDSYVKPKLWENNFEGNSKVLYGQKSKNQIFNGLRYGINADDSISIMGYIGDKKELEIPKIIDNKKVTGILVNSFCYNYDIEKIFIPKSVKQIEENAFYYCDNLTIYCENSVRPELWENNFEGISKVLFGQKNKNQIFNGLQYGINEDDTIAIYGYVDDKIKLKIPDMINGKSVTEIGYEAFYNCINLKYIELPNSITKLGYKAFFGCENLENLNLPSNLNIIESFVFKNCNNLNKKYFVSKNIEYIGKEAFSKKFTLYSPYYDTPKKWDKNWCIGEVYWGHNQINQEFNGYSYGYLNEDEIYIYDYNGNRNVNVVNIPEKINGATVRKICHGTFWGYKYDYIFNLPSSIEYIDQYVFDFETKVNCFSKNLKYIGYKVFDSWCNLKILIPKDIEYIDEEAFYNIEKSEIYNESNKIINSRYVLEFSKEEPNFDKENYWHYVNGVPTRW